MALKIDLGKVIFFLIPGKVVNEMYSPEESHALQLIKVSALNHGLGLLISSPAQSSENFVQHFRIPEYGTPALVFGTLALVYSSLFFVEHVCRTLDPACGLYQHESASNERLQLATNFLKQLLGSGVSPCLCASVSVCLGDLCLSG